MYPAIFREATILSRQDTNILRDETIVRLMCSWINVE